MIGNLGFETFSTLDSLRKLLVERTRLVVSTERTIETSELLKKKAISVHPAIHQEGLLSCPFTMRDSVTQRYVAFVVLQIETGSVPQ